MMRQPVGVGVERRVAQRAVLEHHRDRVRRARGLRGKQRRQRRRARNRLRRCRSSRAGWCRARPPSRIGRRPSGALASATAASSSRTSRAPSASTVAASNRSLAYSSTPSIPAGAPSAAAPLDERQPTGRTSRSPSRPAAASTASPGSSSAAGPPASPRLERQHHLEQRMPRQRPRRIEHLDQPLERQLRHGHRPQGCRPAPGRSARVKLGLPEVSVRSTSVLTKNPIRSSSAASVRPAIGLPIAMSVPAPSRRQQSGKPRLQHHEQARAGLPRQRRQPAVQLRARAAAARRRRGGSTPRPRPVGRQLDLLRQLLQGVGPERQAAARSRCRSSASSPSTACCHSV